MGLTFCPLLPRRLRRQGWVKLVLALIGPRGRVFYLFVVMLLASGVLAVARLTWHGNRLGALPVDAAVADRHISAPSYGGLADRALRELLFRVFPAETVARVQVAPYRAAAVQGGPDEGPWFSVRVVQNGSALLVEADGVLSACSAVHFFCLHAAACTTTWGQRQKSRFPRTLPQLPALTGAEAQDRPPVALMRRRALQHAYYLNFCTPSYTMAFWDWARWEAELDWMALHGIDMPLIITGREVVMRRLFKEYGLSDVQILSFFTGPAFLAWHRMGNLKGFAGPMPPSYLDHSEELTRKILARARELGMRPVLPGFSGHVPDQLASLHEQDHFSRLPLWSGFPAEYSGLLFVEPTSELYLGLGKRFIEIQTEMFGTDNLYAVDQFNENNPRSNAEDYLSKCGESQFRSLTLADPRAVWVMQGWLFVYSSAFWGHRQIEAYLKNVPKNGMIVLDLTSESSPAYDATMSFHGKPFIWSVLHNFGGQIGLRGNLKTIMDRPYKALAMPGSTMVGVGLTMEAINQNPIIYELALDHVWNDRPRSMNTWLKTWTTARYGWLARGDREVQLGGDARVQEAWALLLRSCYQVMDVAQGNGFWGVTKSVIEKRPSLIEGNVVTNGFQESALKYSACDLVKAWELLAAAAQEFVGQSSLHGTAFELDVLDVTRQVLSNHAQALYLRFVRAARHAHGRHSSDSLVPTKVEFLRLLDDLDGMLETSPHFSLSTWVVGARSIAMKGHADTAETALYSFNAHNLLTLWGPQGQISDYSARLWGGLIRRYYRPRWSLAMEAVTVAASASGRRVGDEAFGDEAFGAQVRDFEQKWQSEGDTENEEAAAAAAAKGRSPMLAALEAVDSYRDRVSTSCREVK